MKRIAKYLLYIMITIILILFPFLIEKMILCETIFPFNIPINLSKETWFGFVASYLGAVGTVMLGIIALYQNKKYKELSDSSEEKFITLQNEIKTLTEKSVALIELNSKIEQAKYYPILTNINYSYWNTNGKNITKKFDLKKDAFQISYNKVNPNEMLTSYKDVFNQYHTFVYTLKNDGEQTIRNFNCKSIVKNDAEHEFGFWLFQSCDIEPGALLRCVYATEFNLAEQCQHGEIQSLKFQYEMENVIGDRFEMTCDFFFFPVAANEAPNFSIEISPIQRL